MNKIKMTFAICLILSLIGCTTTGVKGNSSAESKKADIDKLVEMTVTQTFMDSFLSSYMQVLAQNLPSTTAEDKAKFKLSSDVVVKVLSENMPSLIVEIAPLYDKYYTHDEIRDMIAFYNTPTGKKTIKVAPALSQDAMQIGAQWGAELAPLIEKGLIEKGIIE